MDETNRFAVGIRVSWSDIKEHVYVRIYIIPLDSHYFKAIFTTMREDNVTVLDWIRTMSKLGPPVKQQSTEWAEIVEKEIVPAIGVCMDYGSGNQSNHETLQP